jgi:hypothetical protein
VGALSHLSAACLTGTVWNRCAFVGLVQDGAVYSKARLDERIRNSPGQEQGYESLSEPAATNAVAASVASSAAADSDDELVE